MKQIENTTNPDEQSEIGQKYMKSENNGVAFEAFTKAEYFGLIKSKIFSGITSVVVSVVKILVPTKKGEI